MEEFFDILYSSIIAKILTLQISHSPVRSIFIVFLKYLSY